jgi:lysyl-tRNA synthetase class II
VLLCPCLHMLPKNTLTDPEVRFRHRCVHSPIRSPSLSSLYRPFHSSSPDLCCLP